MMRAGPASHRAIAVALAFACAAIFLALAHPPWPSWPLASLDMRVFEVLQSARSPPGDALFGAITQLGDRWFVAGATCVAALALIAAHRVRDACILLVCMALTGYVSTELKAVFERGRPLAPHNLGSFPSSHAALAAALGISATYLAAMRWRAVAARRRLIAAGVLVAALVGFTRMYLGAHWLSDVLAGHALGCCAALLVVAAVPRPRA